MARRVGGRAGADQNASRVPWLTGISRQRLGVRRPSAAFRPMSVLFAITLELSARQNDDGGPARLHLQPFLHWEMIKALIAYERILEYLICREER